MAKIHLLSASIALAGDITNVAIRSASNPVTYPELLVLQEIHGEGCIRDCEVIGERDTNVVAEKARLVQKYGAVVEQVYPGRSPQMELVDPTYKPAKAEKPNKPKADTKTDAKAETEDADTASEDKPAADPFAI